MEKFMGGYYWLHILVLTKDVKSFLTKFQYLVG